MEDQELLGEFVVEAKEHLADVENQFLAIEDGGADVDVDLVNEVFRAIHSIKGAAGFLGLTTVNDLAHNLENVLNMMRNRELVPTSPIVDAMLRAADTLSNMIDDVENSGDVDVSGHITELEAIASGDAPAAAPAAGDAQASDEDPTDRADTVEEAAGQPPADDAAAGGDDGDDLDAQIAAAFAAQAEAREAKTSPRPSTAPASAPTASTPATEAKKKATAAPAADANIRVSVGVLDSLMNLAGELVLSRNQLMQAISSDEKTGLEAISARVDQVTSELQEAIMQTRMQQIGTVFGRFPRVVRDLGAKLGKQCDLVIEGKDVEVDKTIVEAIGDPLTHLVRNSMDHGIESPAERARAGKPATGTVCLKACYQAGKVRIEIQDDGAGINPQKLKEKAIGKGILTPEKAEGMSEREALRLIFAPGFSTAKEVTDVSGRGVGMDVVRTNIAKLGGTVDVESTPGQGTNMVVTLPLTLAIIPSLIIQVGGDRFAIPQVNIAELVRVRESEREEKLGRVKDSEVLRLRGSLLPLIRLNEALGCESQGERRDAAGATNIIVVDTGQTRFGMVVDGLHDSEEIVVKPLGRHHKNCRCLAGATILGDGHVALILDIAGVAVDADLRSDEELRAAAPDQGEGGDASEELQSVLLFENAEQEHFAVPMEVIARIERVTADKIKLVGGCELLQYNDSTLPLLRLEHCINAHPADPTDSVYVVVFEARGREIGLVAPTLRDIRDVSTNVDTVTFREQGVIGSLVIEDRTTRMIDLFEVTELTHPEWLPQEEVVVEASEGLPPLVLLAEDSTFFRNQVQSLLESKGYRVEPCEDGLEAWQKVETGEYCFDIVLTDIEMPNMDGFQLCQRVKDNPATSHLPVIALTSLAGATDIQHGIEVGVDDYQIKMDREKLLTSLRNFCDPNANANKTELVGSYA